MEMDTKTKKSLWFFAVCGVIVLINHSFVRQLAEFSSSHEFASHIVLIPLVSLGLLFRKRDVIFAQTGISPVLGPAISLAALIAVAWIDGTSHLSEKTLAMVSLVIGLFLTFYGRESFKKALFPLFLLFLMTPIPDSLVQQITAALQKGSAEMVAVLFKLTGTPFYREGMTFALPKIGIEIAAQCSGIRSSIALLLSSLMAAHLMLNKPSRRLALVLAAIPMAMFKNAVRIATLSLLAIHVDVGFIEGSDLHQKGGILFFITALLLMAPLLWILRRSEKA